MILHLKPYFKKKKETEVKFRPQGLNICTMSCDYASTEFNRKTAKCQGTGYAICAEGNL